MIETNFGDGIVAELFRKHLVQTKQNIAIEEVRANVRKEDRIIDSLEPVLNQHRLVVDRTVIDDDFKSKQSGGMKKMVSLQRVELDFENTQIDYLVDRLFGITFYSKGNTENFP